MVSPLFQADLTPSWCANTAVIIVHWNTPKLLRRCLLCLRAQTLPPERVIVVDNHSKDFQTNGLDVAYPNVEVIQLSQNIGFAAANNLAIKRVEDCSWIALLNPDAFPEPNWLEKLHVCSERNPEYACFASLLLKESKPGILDGTGDVYHVSGRAWRRDEGQPIDRGSHIMGEVFGPCAAAALYRRVAIERAGGFDERYFCYFEDVDLAFRLRLLGYRCLYVPDAIARHVGSAAATRHSAFSMYYGHRNLVWTYVKNMPPLLFWFYLPLHIALNIGSLLWFSLQGEGSILWRAKIDAIQGLPEVWRQRKKIQATRRVSQLKLRRTMHGGWPFTQAQ